MSLAEEDNHFRFVEIYILFLSYLVTAAREIVIISVRLEIYETSKMSTMILIASSDFIIVTLVMYCNFKSVHRMGPTEQEGRITKQLGPLVGRPFNLLIPYWWCFSV